MFRRLPTIILACTLSISIQPAGSYCARIEQPVSEMGNRAMQQQDGSPGQLADLYLIGGLMSTTTMRFTSDGKMLGMQCAPSADGTWVLFTDCKHAQIGGLSFGAGHTGTSWVMHFSKGGIPSTARQVGKIGFDLAGTAVGVVLHDGALYCLNPSGELFSISARDGMNKPVVPQFEGTLNIADLVQAAVPGAKEPALHRFSERGAAGVEVIVEARTEANKLALVQVGLSWKEIATLPKVRQPMGRVPKLFYLGQTKHKGETRLVGYDLQSNQMQVFSPKGTLTWSGSLMTDADHRMYRRALQVIEKLFKKDAGWSIWSVKSNTSCYGTQSTEELSTLQMGGFFQLVPVGDTAYVTYFEFGKRTLVFREFTGDSLGPARPLAVIGGLIQYKIVPIGQKAMVLTIEDNVNKPLPAGVKYGQWHRVYAFDKLNEKQLADWHDPIQKHKVVGTGATYLLLCPVPGPDSVTVYSAPVVTESDSPLVTKKVITAAK